MHDHGTRDTAPSPQALRLALGRFATGVTIVTCRAVDGSAAGLTANSFSGVSLDPPLVLWSLRRASPSLPVFAAARHFNVNVLAEAQVDLSRRFASALHDKFTEGVWSDGSTGVPMLAGCAAVFECEAQLRHEVGDHLLIIGRVLGVVDSVLPPLVFQSGRYHMLGEIV
ncbi:MAG: flavin reductase family protein [Burkholderiaceae bacterium]